MRLPNQLGNYMNIFSESRPWRFIFVISELLLEVNSLFFFLDNA